MRAGAAQVAQPWGAGPDLFPHHRAPEACIAPFARRMPGVEAQRAGPPPPDAEAGCQIGRQEEKHRAVNVLLMQRGFVPVYPKLAEVCGSSKATLMLGQAIGLSRTWLQDAPSRGGWFWMSAAEWQDATGLTPREQEPAREALVQSGLWEERRTYNPSRLYFRVHLPALAGALDLEHKCAALTRPKEPGAWQWDAKLAPSILGESLLFFKPLADLTGDVTAGMLLSLLLAEQRQALHTQTVDQEGRFPVQFSSLVSEALIGPKALRNARARLRLAGFTNEAMGPGKRTSVRLNLTAILACLREQPTTPMQDRVANARVGRHGTDQRPVCAPARPAQSQSVKPSAHRRPGTPESGQMSLLEPPLTRDPALGEVSAKAGRRDPLPVSVAGTALHTRLAAGNPALLSIANSESWPMGGRDGALLSIASLECGPLVGRDPALSSSDILPLCRVPIQRTRTEKQQQPARAARPRESCGGGVGKTENQPPGKPGFGEEDLVVPDGIDRASALRAIRDLPAATQQVVLDELAGCMLSKRKVVESPLALLLFLAREAFALRLVPARAQEVREAREAKRRAAAREAAMMRSPAEPAAVRAPAPVVSPTRSEAASAALAKMQRVRAEIAAGGRGRVHEAR